MQWFCEIESNQFQNGAIDRGTIERDEFKLVFKNKLAQADRRCTKKEKGTLNRRHSKKNLHKRENAHYLRWVWNTSAFLDLGLAGHERSWWKSLDTEDVRLQLIDVWSPAHVHCWYLKVFIMLFLWGIYLVIWKICFPGKLGKLQVKSQKTKRAIYCMIPFIRTV